jgi:hypothetical protein
MEWENILFEYDKAKEQVFAQALVNDGNTEAIQDAWTQFCLASGRVREEAVKVIAELQAEVDTLSDVHKKWLAMVEQSDADNALINLLHQEVFYWKQKLAAVDEIAVGYFEYIENDAATAEDEAFYPSEEQLKVLVEAQLRVANAAYEAALDAIEAQQHAQQAEPVDLHTHAADLLADEYAANWLIGQGPPG